MNLSRRGFLQALGIGTGLALTSRGARAAGGEPTSVVVLHLQGGYNALFASADSLVGKFGVTATNHKVLGNGKGPGIDQAWFDSMSTFTKQHMAAVGIAHGISNHPGARQ